MIKYKYFLLLFSLLCVVSLQAVNGKVIYVSTKGSDLNAGTLHSPFKSLEKARDEIRKLKKENDKQSFKVLIFGGKYFLDKPFVLTAEDSGSVKSAIVYEAKKGEVVRIIGGVEVNPSAFDNLNSADPDYSRINTLIRNKIKVLDLNKAGITDLGILRRRGFSYMNEPSPMELSVNNRIMQLARWPNNGLTKSGKAADVSGFTYTKNNPDKWTEEKDAWVLGYWQGGWSDLYSPIDKIDTLNKTIKLADRSGGKVSRALGTNRKWFGINILAELDIPGEYYIDRENKRLYVYPPENADFQSSEIMLSMLGENREFIITASGLKNVIFRNISLEKSRFGALSVTNSENITIDGCTFNGTGNVTVRLRGKNIRMQNSEIFDCGAGGSQVEGGDRYKLISGNIVIENCHFHHFGLWNRTASPGVRITGGVGSIIRNCQFNDCPHYAIRFDGNNHLIELSEFFNVCYETDDAGGIYCGRDWAMYGTIIRFNYLHDIESIFNNEEKNVTERLGVHGIYLDDCASGITVFGNVFNNISGRAIMGAGGRDLKIDNNIIVNCGAAHFTDRRGLVWIVDKPGSDWNLLEKVKKFNYTQPPWSTAYPSLAKLMDDGYEKAKEPLGCEITNNIGFNNKVWLEKDCLGACGGFDFYHFEGNLENSDPLFVDKSNLMKGVSKKSPIYTIKGFKKIPFEKIGLKNK